METKSSWLVLLLGLILTVGSSEGSYLNLYLTEHNEGMRKDKRNKDIYRYITICKYIHTYIHTHTHIYTYIHLQFCCFWNKYTSTHYTYIHTSIHTYIHTSSVY